MKKSIGIVLGIGGLLVSCTNNPHMANTKASNTDSYFMIQAAYANMSLAEATQLAGQKAEHGPLKALASELATDYKNAYDELKEISSELNYPIPSRVNREHLEEEMILLNLYGKEFDTAYIGRQIRNNLRMIDLLEVEANGGHDPFLRRYAIKYIPVIKQHVYRADSILAIINTSRYVALEEK